MGCLFLTGFSSNISRSPISLFSAPFQPIQLTSGPIRFSCARASRQPALEMCPPSSQHSSVFMLLLRRARSCSAYQIPLILSLTSLRNFFFFFKFTKLLQVVRCPVLKQQLPSGHGLSPGPLRAAHRAYFSLIKGLIQFFNN